MSDHVARRASLHSEAAGSLGCTDFYSWITLDVFVAIPTRAYLPVAETCRDMHHLRTASGPEGPT